MSERGFKVLLVGPSPPPHGGISVHVDSARKLLEDSGVRCRVLDPGGHRDDPGLGSRWRRWFGTLAAVRRSAGNGWTVHFHTNGHNAKSWLLALLVGRAARHAPERILTLHSGMVPAWLHGAPWRRSLAGTALAGFERVVCVNPEILRAIAPLATDPRSLEVRPAYLPAPRTGIAPPEELTSWMSRHDPILAATLFFRPEYGFELLLDTISRLERDHPGLGCLVLGDGEGAQRARALLEPRGLRDAVLLAGDVPHDLCLELMARSDLFVRPTLVDGDAISVREALSLGLPVVASDTGTRPEGVHLFPPGDGPALEDRIREVLGGDRSRRPDDPTASPESPQGDLLGSYLRSGEGVPCR